MRSTSAFLAGAGAAYFLDPSAGKRRRHVARDRFLKALRRSGRFTLKRLELAGGRSRGLLATAERAVRKPEVATDDTTVVQRIRSDALRDVDVRTKDIDVRVAKGVATLRGSVSSGDEADRVVARVRKVPGVRDVAAELHVGGK